MVTGVTRTVLPNLLLGTRIYENSHCVTELRQITFKNEILFVSFLHSRPPTSFPWFTSPLKALRHIIWGRYKWHILGFLLFLLFVSLIAFFVYAAPVSVTCQIAQSSNYCIFKIHDDNTFAFQSQKILGILPLHPFVLTLHIQTSGSIFSTHFLRICFTIKSFFC